MPDGGQQADGATTGAGPATGGAPLVVHVHGHVDAGDAEYALRRIDAVLDHVAEPVLFARLTLTLANDPARTRPALAQATVDVNGDVILAHASAGGVREAADLLHDRLQRKLVRRATSRRARQRRGVRPEPGEWRHGDRAAARPAGDDLPTER